MEINVIYATIIVKNHDESVKFYRDALGFTPAYHVDLPIGQITVMQSPAGAGVELIECAMFPVGLYSVGTDVDDLDKAIEHIKSCGGSFFGEITATTVGRQIFAVDPNGVRVCLIEHAADYKEKYMKD